jgi:hypothetical protein
MMVNAMLRPDGAGALSACDVVATIAMMVNAMLRPDTGAMLCHDPWPRDRFFVEPICEASKAP